MQYFLRSIQLFILLKCHTLANIWSSVGQVSKKKIILPLEPLCCRQPTISKACLWLKFGHSKDRTSVSRWRPFCGHDILSLGVCGLLVVSRLCFDGCLPVTVSLAVGGRGQTSCKKGLKVTWAMWPGVPERAVAAGGVMETVVDKLALIASFLFPISTGPNGAGEMERQLCNSVGLCPMSEFSLWLLSHLASWSAQWDCLWVCALFTHVDWCVVLLSGLNKSEKYVKNVSLCVLCVFPLCEKSCFGFTPVFEADWAFSFFLHSFDLVSEGKAI